MKFLKSNFFLVISSLLILGSCSIEKRLHMPGYHMEWKKTGKSKTNSDNVEVNQQSVNKLTPKKIFYRENNKSNLSISSSSKNSVQLTPETINSKNNSSHAEENIMTNECDVIIFKKGDEVEVKVLEVGVNEIRYKKCDNLNGPTFTENKSKIFMIKFANGSKTVFDEDTAQNNNNSNNTNRNEDEYLKTIDSDDKSFIVAALLWFFLGLLGIHRFYLGHIGIGVLYLLTGGLCGIGWIIDGILFLVGGLKPKNGTYTDI